MRVAAWLVLPGAALNSASLAAQPLQSVVVGSDFGPGPISSAVTPQPAGEYDPYGPVDEVGPFEPGLGWSCGGSCPPSWRARAEYLYFSRNRGNDSLSNGFRFDNLFDYQAAARITIDRRFDCTQGWEAVYAGPFNFHEQDTAVGAGTLNANFAGRGGIDVSSFFGADLQSQRIDSELHSVEVSYKSWGWNVIATSFGTRYLNLNEDLALASSGANGNGLFLLSTDNQVVLGQFGIDMFLPLGRWSFDTTWKIGIGANFGSSDTFISNAGTVQVNQTDDQFDFASIVEGGAYLRYFITPRVTARVGYEFWWLHGVGLATRQFGSEVSFRTGSDFQSKNEVLFFGASAGIEIVF
jgi:hypothetical protein